MSKKKISKKNWKKIEKAHAKLGEVIRGATMPKAVKAVAKKVGVKV